MDIKKIAIEILIIFIIFLLGFGSKSLILVNSGEYKLYGPDPYLFFRYMENLIYKGDIPNYDVYRYFPLGSGIDFRNLISYFGYFNYLLLQNNIYFSFISFLLNLNGITYIQNDTWFAANSVIPLLFGISSIIFYFLARKIFNDKLSAFISTLIFIASPAITSRVIAFDKEIAALPFILLSFYIYLKAKESKSEIKLIKKILLALFIVFTLIIYSYFTLNIKSDAIGTYLIFLFILALIPMYFIYKDSKEYYYTLLIYTTLAASKGWGGWVFIPLIISVTEIFYFLHNRSDKEYIYFSPYIIFILALDQHLSLSEIISPLNFLPLIPVILKYSYELINKIKVRNIQITRLSYLVLLLILASPIFIHFLYTYILINPFAAERFATSIAEFQPTPTDFYEKVYTDVLLFLTFFGILSLMYREKIDLSSKKEFYTLIFILILNIAINSVILIYNSYVKQFGIILSIFSILISIYIAFSLKKRNLDKIQSILLSMAFILTFYSIIFYSEIGIANNISITLAWLLIILIILPYFLVFKRDLKEIDIFVLIMFFIFIIFGKYSYRAVFFSGISSSILSLYFLRWFDIFREKDKEIAKYTTLIILTLLAVSSVSLFISIRYLVFLVPLGFFSYYLYIFLKKNEYNFNFFRYSIILLFIYGIGIVYGNKVYGFTGYMINYIQPLFMGSGTDDFIISSMLYIDKVSSEDAIVHSWWDYGYYIQTLANRTSWLDGGNAYPYWNHLMGRYGFSSSFKDALELFYVHSSYNYNTFKILELFGKNDIFYKYLYQKLNFTENEIKIIKNLKERLGNKWIELLFKFNGSYIEGFNLSEGEYEILNKLYRMNYVRDSYLYIDPTDIGKSYQFMKLGADSKYDKASWVTIFQSAIEISPNTRIGLEDVVYVKDQDKYFAVFAKNSTLIYLGRFMLDEDLKINNSFIPRCIPELGVMNCGEIVRIDLIFNKPLIYTEGIYEKLNYSAISIENLEDAYVYITYNRNLWKLRLYCVFFNGELKYFNNSEYNGCLYISSVFTQEYSGYSVPKFSNAYFISQKIFNYSWIQLYFFNNGEPYFNLMYYSNQFIFSRNSIISLPPIIYSDIPPAKVWKIKYPENLTIPEYKYCLYLATNLEEINKCAEIYNLPKYNSYYDV